MKRSGLIARVALVLAAAGSMAGCVTELALITWSDDKMAAKTAAVIGVPSEDVRLSDKSDDLGHVYYVAKTRRGKTYKCSVANFGTPICKPFEKW